MLPEFAAYAKKANVHALAAPHEGCPPFRGIAYPETDYGAVCRALNETSARVAFQPEITTVILVGRWTAVAAGVQYGADGKPIFTGTGSDSSDAFSTAITQTVKSLLAHDKNVVIVGPVPELPFDLSAAMARHTAWGQPLPPEATRDDFLRRQTPILQLLSKLSRMPRVEVVYPHELLCGKITCPYAKAGVPLYVDRDHLSPAGAAQLEPMFQNIFNSDHSVAAAVRISG
ncbi:MAG TPA: SGNH hydrolase domain-containing protein [Hyphomicrobium sp.]|nr:SGNH hydrolase domain-containing protein [Hyphomicrobium sp.]